MVVVEEKLTGEEISVSIQHLVMIMIMHKYLFPFGLDMVFFMIP